MRVFILLCLVASLLYTEARPDWASNAAQYVQGLVSSPADAFAQCIKSGLSVEVCREKIKEVFSVYFPYFVSNPNPIKP